MRCLSLPHMPQAGQVGMYGYSQYSATKFALRGLAEALSMEVRASRWFDPLSSVLRCIAAGPGSSPTGASS